MTRRVVAPLALVAGLLLATEGSAYWVFPGRHISSLTHEQETALLHALQHTYSPELSARMVDTAIVVRRNGGPRTVRFVVGEDTPGELPPVIVVVVTGNTVQDAGVRTLMGDGDYDAPPEAFHLGLDTVLLFNGEPSDRRRLLLYFNIRFESL